MEGYKPSDLFLGVVDFFAILLPGALLAFAVKDIFSTSKPNMLLPQLGGELQGWAAFFFVSYVLGHLTFAVAANLDDWVYDDWYVKGKRGVRKIAVFTYSKEGPGKENTTQEGANGATPIPRMKGPEGETIPIEGKGFTDVPAVTQVTFGMQKAPTFKVLNDSKLEAVSPRGEGTVDVTITRDPLLAHATELKDKHLQQHTEEMNTFNWATAAVRLQSPAAITEIDRLEADSKFFRSLTIAIPLFAIYLVVYRGYLVAHPADQENPWLKLEYVVAAVLCAIFLTYLCLRRFLQQRWKRTQLTYQFYIALQHIHPSTPSGQSGGPE